MLVEGVDYIGDFVVCNKGMLGGSFVYVDLVVDWLVMMLVVNVKIIIVNLKGECQVDVGDFFQGFYMIVLDEGELIISVEIFVFVGNYCLVYVKFEQLVLCFVIVGCVVMVDVSSGSFKDVCVVFMGVVDFVFRDVDLEVVLEGVVVNVDFIVVVVEKVVVGVDFMEDYYVSVFYWGYLVKVYVK